MVLNIYLSNSRLTLLFKNLKDNRVYNKMRESTKAFAMILKLFR